jgi:hypothetical protein
MYAETARKIAIQANENKISSQYAEISGAIKDYAEEGKFEYLYYTQLVPGVKKILKDEGYDIDEEFDPRTGSTIRISWQNALTCDKSL